MKHDDANREQASVAATLALVPDQFPGLLWTTDTSLVFTSSRGVGLKDLDLKPDEVVGMSLATYFGSDDPDFPAAAAHRRALLGETVHAKQHWLDRDFEYQVGPLRDRRGRIVGCLGVAQDVTERNRLSRMLPAQVAQMRADTERPPDYVLQIDLSGTITFVEPTLPEHAANPVIGTPVRQWVRPETLEIVEAALRQLYATTQPQRLEIPASGPGGSDCWYDVRLRPLKQQDEVIGAVVVVYDISDRKHAELRLREQAGLLERRVAERTEELTAANLRLRDSEERLQSILDNTTAVVYVKDRDGRYQLINSQFARLFHISREGIVGKTDHDLFPAELADRFRENDLRVLSEETPLQFEEVAPHDDGPHHYISIKFPLRDSAGRLCAVCGISTDITDRKQAEEKLRGEEHLLRKLLELHERERKLIAYEIHDGLVQDVVAAKMMLEGLCASEPGAGLPSQRGMVAVERLLNSAIGEGRRLIGELRPLVLDERGIIGSIEYLIAEHFQKSGLKIRFTHQLSFERLSPLLEGTLFRIVQEALNNVRRHSQVTEAEVRLWNVDGQGFLEIRDAGVGFDPDNVPPDRFGVRGIQERSRLFGGRAKIVSRPGQGTVIHVEVPLIQIDEPQRHETAPPRNSGTAASQTTLGKPN